MSANLIAAVQQLALAATFVIVPIAAWRYGERAQQAAEKSIVGQGITSEKDFLLKRGVKFCESGWEVLLPFAIAGALTIIGMSNLLGNEFATLLTWSAELLLLVVVGTVTAAPRSF